VLSQEGGASAGATGLTSTFMCCLFEAIALAHQGLQTRHAVTVTAIELRGDKVFQGASSQ